MYVSRNHTELNKFNKTTAIMDLWWWLITADFIIDCKLSFSIKVPVIEYVVSY